MRCRASGACDSDFRHSSLRAAGVEGTVHKEASRCRGGSPAVAGGPAETNASDYHFCSEPERMSQGDVNLTHRQLPDHTVNRSLGDGCQIVSHDDRVSQEA